ncbi:hypothetical protein GUJ93_ZPchr0006g44570 [Zizania palustris]|uniref:Uncharacterized protein n=1 Tax=Zizania palustris TaxID=103762 RepID=A0A8J5TFQ8_ZIZPA|nr:hypothetical protein GUJ93_ZPchr0006g44570 [Zizania palustris]
MAAPGSLGVYNKVVFAALGVLMVGSLVYTCVTDGSPFRLELLRSLSMEEDWMSVTGWYEFWQCCNFLCVLPHRLLVLY